MGVMSRFAKLDSAMQRGLDNGLARVFGGKVVPAEIEELLKQEIEDNMVHTYEGYIEAPNVFDVAVSPKDFSNLVAEHPHLPAEFADQLSRHIRNNGWQAAGEVIVTIASLDSLKTGQLKAHSDATSLPQGTSGYEGEVPKAPAPAEAPPQAPAEPEYAQPSYTQPVAEEPWGVDKPTEPAGAKTVNLLLHDGSSRTYAVREGSNIIGRSTEADFRLPDTGVSREHAEITWDGEDAVLVDLQSTNGTTVNDIPVENWMLADGDVINVGHSTIEVRITQS